MSSNDNNMLDFIGVKTWNEVKRLFVNTGELYTDPIDTIPKLEYNKDGNQGK